MNIIFSGFSGESSVIPSYLAEKIHFNDVHLVVDNKNDIRIDCKNYLLTKNCQLGYFDDVDKYEDIPISQNLLNKLTGYESIVLKMMDRYQTMDALFTYEARINLYHKQVKYWDNYLQKEKIDLCVLSNLPHVIYDYILYALCKISGIKIIMMYRLPVIPHKNVSVYLLYDIIEHIPDLREDYLFFLNNEDKWHLSERMLSYLELKEGNEDKTFTGISRESSSFIKKKINKLKVTLSFLRKSDMLNIIYYYSHKLNKRSVTAPNYQNNPDLDCKYIYISLHFQPECTTCPMGGEFVHQDLMIDIIKKSITKDIKIYIKEHPRRSVDDRVYINTKIDSQVEFINPQYNSYSLIKNCLAVATITGTAGWEGFLNNKPVLMFGDYFYQDAPGVYKVKSQCDCVSAMKKIIENKALISDAQINAFLKAVEKNTFPGWVDTRYATLSTMTEDENCKNIANHLSKAICDIYK